MKQRKASNRTEVNIKQHMIKAFSLTFHIFITSCLKTSHLSLAVFFLCCCCFSVCMVDWIIDDELSGEGMGVHWFHGNVPCDLQTEKLHRLPASSCHKTQTSNIEKHLASLDSDSCFVVPLDAIYWPAGQIWWWPVDAKTLAASHCLDASFFCFCLGSWCKFKRCP